MKYLWTEDTGAGLHFWKLVNQLFFDDALVVESKESNQGLLDALADIDMKEDDKYYIAFDYVVDNQDIRSSIMIMTKPMNRMRLQMPTLLMMKRRKKQPLLSPLPIRHWQIKLIR